jgi:hypothetical protein
MPMSFPDMRSLKQAARVHKFREPNENESEAEFRSALVAHVKPIDMIESYEIKFGVGWDRFTDEQNRQMFNG